jgi:hypothetical protein
MVCSSEASISQKGLSCIAAVLTCLLWLRIEHRASHEARSSRQPLSSFPSRGLLLLDLLRTLASLPFLALITALLSELAVGEITPYEVPYPYRLFPPPPKFQRSVVPTYPEFSTSHCYWQAGRSSRSCGQDLDSCRTCL